MAGDTHTHTHTHTHTLAGGRGLEELGLDGEGLEGEGTMALYGPNKAYGKILDSVDK